VRPFITAADWRPVALTERANLKALIVPRERQLELFAG
jgi:predicted DNA-binding helix-hairpin-helix protein